MPATNEPLAHADILIVDDNPNNLDLLSEVLASNGYEFRVATSGRRALAAVAARAPELVLLDISMPEMDGYEVCRQLKADPATARIPVLFLSALGEAFDKVRAFEVGGADYVGKPFQVAEVVARIENQLRVARLQADLEARNAELVALSRELEAANRELARLSVTDPLTGVANRRHLHDQLEREWRRARRDQAPLSALMIDVDFFKLYNDGQGHQAGDDCLRRVAEAVATGLSRGGDLVARYGGEELFVVLPATGAEAARELAEGLLERVRALAIPHPTSAAAPVVTVSIGVATVVPDATTTATELVARADRALYAAKQGGRDRVVTASNAE